MKFRVGDKVKVTGGKDKGKTALIKAVNVEAGTVVVEGVNQYTKNIKPMMGQPGQRVVKERPMNQAKIAIINDKGEVDRIGYQVAKDGQKVRIFRKTGKVVAQPALKKAKK
jgi:large subunit ribosomal protein L24